MSKYSKVTLTIDDEVADQLVCSSLEVSISVLKDEISKLNKKKKLKDYEKEDLSHCHKYLVGLELAFDYYGGNMKKTTNVVMR